MPNYQFCLSMTVEADTEEDARYTIGEFLTAATIGEQNPIIDYSIDELQEVSE